MGGGCEPGVGDEFDLPVNLRVDESDRTAILILHSACRFCVESMPFYRSVLTERQEVRPYRLVVVALEPVAGATAFLESHGVKADAVRPYWGAGRIRFTGTPTLLVVDRWKRVIGVWTGKLTPDEERRVRALLQGSSRARVAR